MMGTHHTHQKFTIAAGIRIRIIIDVCMRSGTHMHTNLYVCVRGFSDIMLWILIFIKFGQIKHDNVENCF